MSYRLHEPEAARLLIHPLKRQTDFATKLVLRRSI